MAGISFGTNISVLSAKRGLDNANASAARTFERLSSGLRINRSSDDAAGLAIASDLNSRSRVYGQAIRNINDGQSALSIADSTVADLSTIVIRIRELAQQSANGAFSSTQRISLDKEAQELSKEFFRISRSARFNGLNLFDGSQTQGLRLQAGYGTDGSVQSSLGGVLGTGTFQNISSYTADTGVAYDVALKDLNADGILDLVVAGGNNLLSQGSAYIRFGSGDGTFGAAISYATEGTYSSAVALEDINGDGIIDLVTAGKGSLFTGVASVRLGLGNGTFAASTSYDTEGTTSSGLMLKDVNGDGKLDLITAGISAGVGQTSIRLGAGDGTFGAATTYATGISSTNALTLGDINGDGILDLLTVGTNSGAGLISIRLGVGNGTFGASATYAAEASGSNKISLGDLNGDGILDLVSAGTAAGAGYATVRFGAGNGTFGTATSYATDNSGSSALSLGDVNGDGILDLVTAGSGGGTGRTTIRLGRGDGTFSGTTSYVSGSGNAYGVALADVTGDGVLDVVTAGTNSGAGGVSVKSGITREGINPLLDFSLKTQADSLQAIGYLDRKLSSLSSQRGVIGAFQSRLETALANLLSTREHYSAAASRITDVDIAGESANLIRTQISQQAATAVLAQANQSPAIALQLLRGA